MRKLIIHMLLFVNVGTAMAQVEWKTSGNSGSASTWIGTSNAFPFTIKTNNTERWSISPAGVFKFNSLSGSGNAVLLLDANGNASRFNLNGTASQIITANGAVTDASSLTGWTMGSGKVSTPYKVGIGITNPINALEVNGNGAFTGTVYAEHFTVADASMVQGQLSFTGNMIMNGYDPISSHKNEIYTTTQPYYLQSAALYNNNTIINYNNTGKVGVGTESPAAKFHVYGNTRLQGDVTITGETMHEGKSRFYRIAALPGDSIIRFGDSTIHLDHVNNRLYSGGHIGSIFLATGLGIGSISNNATSAEALCLGSKSQASALQALTLGHNLKSTAIKSITIGSGTSTTALTNNITNSLMVGFNSNIPTLFVGASPGADNIGKVGIGTTSPLGNFQLLKAGVTDAYISSSTNGKASLWVSNSLNAYSFGINGSGMGQISDGSSAIISFMHGNVGIGTTCLPYGHPYKLSVDGKILCEGVRAKMSDGSGCWPDYVFDAAYRPMSIEHLEEYVARNKHLPGVPAEQEIIKEGIDLVEMNKVLLKSIEENTLYIIELKKENTRIKADLEELKQAVKQK